MERQYGKIEFEKNGRIGINVCQGFSLWEMTDDFNFEHVVVDTAPSGASIAYESIPKVIEYLQAVYKARIIEGKMKINLCCECKRPLPDER